MREFLNIGPTPPEESCAQVGDENYIKNACAECLRYIKLLREVFGPEPYKAQLMVKRFPHEFGDYLEVVCWYDTDREDSFSYALACEGYGPLTWDDNRKRDYKFIRDEEH